VVNQVGTLTAASDEAAAVAAAEAAGLRAEVAQLRATAENVQRLEASLAAASDEAAAAKQTAEDAVSGMRLMPPAYVMGKRGLFWFAWGESFVCRRAWSRSGRG
jgi:hypothetical protein